MVPVALSFIDATRDETCGVAGRMMFVEWLLLMNICGGGRSGVRSSLKVEAEKRVAEEIVKSGPGAVPVVSEFRVGTVAGDAELLPFGDVGFGDVLPGLSIDPGITIIRERGYSP